MSEGIDFNMSGRNSIYEDKIKSRFTDIEKWIKGGATEKQVAEALDIAYSTFNKWKAKSKEFREFLKSINRTEIILDLRSALLKKAMGFPYQETKKYIKKDDEGKEWTYTEITEKQSLPDVAAINLALKNYDTENWANDPAMLRLKQQELDLKKQIAEKDNW